MLAKKICFKGLKHIMKTLINQWVERKYGVLPKKSHYEEILCTKLSKIKAFSVCAVT